MSDDDYPPGWPEELDDDEGVNGLDDEGDDVPLDDDTTPEAAVSELVGAAHTRSGRLPANHAA